MIIAIGGIAQVTKLKTCKERPMHTYKYGSRLQLNDIYNNQGLLAIAGSERPVRSTLPKSFIIL
jgi:hypothetical protein